MGNMSTSIWYSTGGWPKRGKLEIHQENVSIYQGDQLIASSGCADIQNRVKEPATNLSINRRTPIVMSSGGKTYFVYLLSQSAWVAFAAIYTVVFGYVLYVRVVADQALLLQTFALGIVGAGMPVAWYIWQYDKRLKEFQKSLTANK